MDRLAPRVVVPGHGVLGTREDVQRMIGYVADLTAIAEQLVVAHDATATAISETEVPEAYADWGQSQFFYANLRALVERAGGRHIE